MERNEATWDTLWIGVELATLTRREADPAGPGEEYGLVHDGALAVRDGRIAWVGPAAELPAGAEPRARRVRRGGGRLLTPGLVDCHTHLVFAGTRADEFEARLKGATYEEIARGGGGILSTVRATRGAAEEELVRIATPRVEALVAEGVTTLEIKSGYGLDPASELRMLRVGRTLGRRLPVEIRTTLLAAHALPPEYAGRRAAYVDLVVEEILPRAVEEGLVDAVDAFLESIAFHPEEVDRIFSAAAGMGVPVRLHADQLADGGGAALAARHRALSADHLEHTSPEGAEAMGEAGTVAVLLPGAFYFLGESKRPPVDAFREHGVAMALATDLNPGSSPARSLLLMLNMGCTLFGLTPAEALAGVTRNAARAMGLDGDRGTLEVGKRADLALWDVEHPGELAYWIGGNPLAERIFAGDAVAG